MSLGKYEWRRGNKWEHLAMEAHGEAQSCTPASHEQFITEHYWGYTARANAPGLNIPRYRYTKIQIDRPIEQVYTRDMSITLEIPDCLYKRLQKHAVPFIDTPLTVIERWADHF